MYTDRHANVKKTGYTKAAEYAKTPQLQTCSDKQSHSAKRRLVSQAFSERALRDYEPLVLEKVRRMCQIMGHPKDSTPDEWSKARDMSHWMKLLNLDVLSSLSLGADFGGLENGHSDIPDLILANIRLMNDIAYLPTILTWLVWPIFKDANSWILSLFNKAKAERIFGFRKKVMEMVKKRMGLEKEYEQQDKATTPARGDLFHHVLAARDPENGAMLPPEAYVGEAAVLLGAGIDTSSITLAATFFYLIQNPEKLEKLQSEIRTTFSDMEDIKTGVQLTSCHYLHACIDETFRMTPAVAGPLHRVAEGGGAIIDGHALPEGSIVSVSAYPLHHNEQYHPAPDTFLPERWLLGSKTPHFEVTDETIAREKAAFTPFSSGPRGCIGKNLVWMELPIVVARLVYLYDMRFAEEGPRGSGHREASKVRRQDPDEFQIEDRFVPAAQGPTVEFKARAVRTSA